MHALHAPFDAKDNIGIELPLQMFNSIFVIDVCL